MFKLFAIGFCLLMSSEFAFAARIGPTTHDFQYGVKIAMHGEEKTLTATVRCIESGSYFDMSGPRWSIRNSSVPLGYDASRTFFVFTNDNQTPMYVMPLPAAGHGWLDDCNPVDNPIRARVFFQNVAGDPFSSMDVSMSAVQTGSSHVLFSGDGPSLVKRGHIPPPAYSIFVKVLDTAHIESLKLRSYIRDNRSLWLTPGQSIPFDDLAKKYLELNYQYRNQLWPFSERPEPLTFAYAKGKWTVGIPRVWQPVGPIDPTLLNRTVARNPNLPFKTTEVGLKGSEIEMPVEQFAWRALYDPSADEIDVVYVDLVWQAL